MRLHNDTTMSKWFLINLQQERPDLIHHFGWGDGENGDDAHFAAYECVKDGREKDRDRVCEMTYGILPFVLYTILVF